MTDWIKHTTDTCPVDPETVVEVRYGSGLVESFQANRCLWWMRNPSGITHYRIITPAPTTAVVTKDMTFPEAKPPEPEMTKTAQEHAAAMFATAIKPEPDVITLRLECLKLAVGMLDRLTFQEGSTVADVADDLLHYVLNGSVDKA
jgi:hypothetical protein